MRIHLPWGIETVGELADNRLNCFGGEALRTGFTLRHRLPRQGRAGLRAAVVVAAAAAAVLTVGAHAAFAQGTLEICKSSANGMSGREFQFSITGGSTVTVKGGRCTGPMSVPHGTVTITELATTPATQVDSIVVRPSARNLGLTGNIAQVNVPAGSTAANETRITFTNVPGGGLTGDLKICKLTDTPAFVGRLYTFHVNGGPGVSTEANFGADDPSSWSCRLVGTFTVGTIVSVKEDIPAGQEIAFIDSDPPDRLVDFDTNTGLAHYEIGSGVTVALYDNEATPPSGTGFIEVCKDPAKLDYRTWDTTVLGEPFDFTIDEADQSSQDITVLGGQCSAPTPVAAGVTRVTEHAAVGFDLVDVFTIPNERLLDSNLINQTADVEVPVSDDPNDETQVHFVNEHQRGQLKICKALGANSSVLEGKTFLFEVIDDTFDESRAITAASSTQCKIVADFPIGDTVDVYEKLGVFPGGEYVQASGPRCENPFGELHCQITIAPGINTLTVTNKALGKLEICKFLTDPETANYEGFSTREEPDDHPFQFRIDGGATIKVKPGRCSAPQLVSVGSHTVTELAETNFELDPEAPGKGIVVTPAAAETARNLLARSVTVSVPWAGDPSQIGQEVRVDYYNRIKRAQIKICKHISPGSEDALGNKEFHFHVNMASATAEPYFVPDLKGGECALVQEDGHVANFPVLLPNGAPNQATVTEIVTGDWHVSSFTLQGARSGPRPVIAICIPVYPFFCFFDPNAVNFDIGPNTNTVHVTNKVGPAENGLPPCFPVCGPGD
jgi:hypothetical protein